jgi:hypothetical protein
MPLQDPRKLLDEMKGEAESETKQPIPLITRFDIDTELGGIQYKGTFTYKVPNLGEQILIGKLKNSYLPDGSSADGHSALLVEQICYLQVTLQDPTPSWWKPMEFHAADIVSILYAKGLAYANTFLGRGDDSGESSSVDEKQESGGQHTLDESDVGEEVSSADERPKTVIAHVARTK